MTIDDILKRQRVLNDAMGNPMRENGEPIKENVIALSVEVIEVLNEINWKPWKKTKKEVDKEALLFELVDVIQFWANIVNEAGFTADDIGSAYSEKLGINQGRIDNGY